LTEPELKSESSIDTIARPIEVRSEKNQPISQLWWLTGFCLLLAIGLGGWSWSTRGIKITVQFRDGYGLRAENRLMHRGIEVGVIEQVRLDETLGNVAVTIRLNDSASAIACEESRFWIERPMVSIQGVRSLETVISGRYVAVEPGPNSSKRVTHFQGLDRPPPSSAAPESLELVIESLDRHGLQTNAPIVYRGIEVGYIQSVGLSADSRWVQMRAVIEPEYRNLICESSRFWNRSGFRIDFGLTGVDIDAESLSTIAMGGIEFATPEPPGKPAKTGRRFELAAKPEEAWLKWQPRLLYGNILSKSLDIAISPQRLSLHWQERLLGFRKNESRNGWILMLSDGSVIGPRDLFEPPDKALDESVRWEAAGTEIRPTQWARISVDAEAGTVDGDRSSLKISRYRLSDFSGEIPQWPIDRLSKSIDISGPSKQLWIACDIPSKWIPIEAHQLSSLKRGGWLLEPSLGISSEQHGAPVIDGESGQIVGMIFVEKRSAIILPLP